MRVGRLSRKIELMTQMLSEKRGQHTLSRPERLTMVNGSEDLEMEKVFNNGLMALDTRDNGKTTGRMEKVNSLISMVISTMETG